MANEGIFKFYTGLGKVEYLYIKLAEEVPHKKDGVSDFEELQRRTESIKAEFSRFGYHDDELHIAAVALQIIQHGVLNHTLGE